MTNGNALSIAREYHDAWTSNDFDRAAKLLDVALRVEVPVNAYPTPESFAEAVTAFGSMTRSVDLLAEMESGDEAMLLYDMDVDGLGPLRVAEHFTVHDGKIARIRQIHDTVALREAGFVAPA
jgi:hypothetical protein